VSWTPEAGALPTCQLMRGRCLAARDCERKTMECKLDAARPEAAGFCVEGML
jgi:hypothetical protein